MYCVSGVQVTTGGICPAGEDFAMSEAGSAWPQKEDTALQNIQSCGTGLATAALVGTTGDLGLARGIIGADTHMLIVCSGCTAVHGVECLCTERMRPALKAKSGDASFLKEWVDSLPREFPDTRTGRA